MASGDDWEEVNDWAEVPSGAPSGPPAQPPSGAEAFLRGVTGGQTFKFGDELHGLIQALGAKSLPESWGGGGAAAGRTSVEDLYRLNRNTSRREDVSAENAHPWLSGLGGLVGGLLTTPLMPGAGLGNAAATLPQMMARGAKVGAATGGVYGLGASDADLSPILGGRLPSGENMLKAGGHVVLGGLVGGSLGSLIPAAASGIGTATRGIGRLTSPLMDLVRGGYVKPTPEAARLMQQGTKLTLGQMDPSSLFGQTEELAANTVTGGPLSALRGRADSGARDAILKAARAEGAKAPTAGAPVEQQLQELRSGFSNLYEDALDREVINPKGTISVFQTAASAKDIDAAPSVRQRALSWLVDQAKTLKPAESGPNAGTVEAKSVQALRTQLRDRIRSLGDEGEDRQLKEIYGRAEKSVTDMLHSQLPPQSSEALRAADAGYKNLLATESAARKAFVQNQEFTPAQMLQAIRSGGSTPGLEAVARDAHAVLAPNYTPTGLQGAAVASIPGFKWIGPAWANLANSSPTLAAHALRPSTGPGLLARTLGASGQALEKAAQESRLSPVQRSLYDLVYGGPMRSSEYGSPAQ